MKTRALAVAAEVLPGSGSIYNDRVMRLAKHTYFQLILVLGLGLVYSQVCNVICAFSNCSTPAKVGGTEAVEHGSHCHQQSQSAQKHRLPEDPHNCPAHGSATSILPSEPISTVVSNDAWQSVTAESVSSFDILFDLAGNGPDRGGRFRSPPHRPLFTILRI